MSKPVLTACIRLRIAAQQAKPSAAIGQALGPLGINMRDFCKDVNAATAQYVAGIPVQLTLSAYSDHTYHIDTRSPQTSWFIKRCAGVEKCSSEPGHTIVGEVTLKQIYEIAKVKQQDPNLKAIPLQSIVSQIINSTKSMGINVVKKRADGKV